MRTHWQMEDLNRVLCLLCLTGTSHPSFLLQKRSKQEVETFETLTAKRTTLEQDIAVLKDRIKTEQALVTSKISWNSQAKNLPNLAFRILPLPICLLDTSFFFFLVCLSNRPGGQLGHNKQDVGACDARLCVA
eukprot:m.909715 g.909715  ORF g.909715 m.909715 type:complete len:133 (+) comp60108_c0_seq66:745-1143(+)